MCEPVQKTGVNEITVGMIVSWSHSRGGLRMASMGKINLRKLEIRGRGYGDNKRSSSYPLLRDTGSHNLSSPLTAAEKCPIPSPGRVSPPRTKPPSVKPRSGFSIGKGRTRGRRCQGGLVERPHEIATGGQPEEEVRANMSESCPGATTYAEKPRSKCSSFLRDAGLYLLCARAGGGALYGAESRGDVE